eukprot:sb/3466605/
MTLNIPVPIVTYSVAMATVFLTLKEANSFGRFPAREGRLNRGKVAEIADLSDGGCAHFQYTEAGRALHQVGLELGKLRQQCGHYHVPTHYKEISYPKSLFCSNSIFFILLTVAGRGEAGSNTATKRSLDVVVVQTLGEEGGYHSWSSEPEQNDNESKRLPQHTEKDGKLRDRVKAATLDDPAKRFFACLLGLAASEAVCETIGSIMEEGQRRFTGAAKTDERLQREMFLKFNGPDMQDFEGLCHQLYERFLNGQVISRISAPIGCASSKGFERHPASPGGPLYPHSCHGNEVVRIYSTSAPIGCALHKGCSQTTRLRRVALFIPAFDGCYGN